MKPDFERAKQYVFWRLQNELSPLLTYHSICHTRDDVLPAAVRLGELTGLATEEALLLGTAALYHDTGFMVSFTDHETYSQAVARDTLPEFGYSAQQIAAIVAIIGATRMPQKPQTVLESILCDADLDLLGRDDFLDLNRKLREELGHFGQRPTSDEQWLCNQLNFLEGHTYFTEAARKLRAEGQERNRNRLRERIARLRLAADGCAEWAAAAA